MFEKILLTTDGSMNSLKAADYAIGLAKKNNAYIEVLYVSEFPKETGDMLEVPPDFNEEQFEEFLKERYHDIIDTTIKRLERAGLSATCKVRFGDTAQVICEEAEVTGCKLIVIGSRGQTAASRFLLGSVSNQVINHAPCPVLVVR